MKTKFREVFGVTLALTATLVVVFFSCTKKETETVTPTNTVVPGTGTETINALYGYNGGTLPTGAGAWYLDQHHCNIGWVTQYNSTGAGLTGRFNIFDMKIKFDQANPANTSVQAWVKLSSCNTGEPGRDGLWISTSNSTVANTGDLINWGCGLNNMGVTATVQTGVATSSTRPYPTIYTVVASSDTAKFKSTSVAKIAGPNYLVKGNFTFRGVTKSVDMVLTYTGITTGVTSATANGTTVYTKTDRAGFHAEFIIDQFNDFPVKASNVAPLVTIIGNANLRSNTYTGTTSSVANPFPF